MTELKLIDFIKNSCHDHPQIEIGIGDDCAVLASHPQLSLVTTDTLMNGTHFILGEASPEQIAHKSFAVNLSDIAAMAGTPEYAVVSLCLPKGISSDFCQRFYRQAHQICSQYKFGIAGGDTNTWNGPLVISITLWGRPHSRGPVLRSGAKPGDKIFVSGPLGGSIDSHHLNFIPRLELAKKIMDRCPINSMIDLSDGLGSDLRHILNASKVGAIIDRDKLPARSNIQDKSLVQRVHHMLSDGEDFELCLTVDPSQSHSIQDISELVEIGIITQETEFRWLHNQQPIEFFGYQHQLDLET